MPIPPLRTVDTAEIAFFIGPLVPNRHAMFLEIFDVRVASKKPKQFVNDRFDVQLLGRQERKIFAQIETCLGAEDRQCPCAGAICARLTFVKNQPKKVVILPHAKKYACRRCSQRAVIPNGVRDLSQNEKITLPELCDQSSECGIPRVRSE